MLSFFRFFLFTSLFDSIQSRPALIPSQTKCQRPEYQQHQHLRMNEYNTLSLFVVYPSNCHVYCFLFLILSILLLFTDTYLVAHTPRWTSDRIFSDKGGAHNEHDGGPWNDLVDEIFVKILEKISFEIWDLSIDRSMHRSAYVCNLLLDEVSLENGSRGGGRCRILRVCCIAGTTCDGNVKYVWYSCLHLCSPYISVWSGISLLLRSI